MWLTVTNISAWRKVKLLNVFILLICEWCLGDTVYNIVMTNEILKNHNWVRWPNGLKTNPRNQNWSKSNSCGQNWSKYFWVYMMCYDLIYRNTQHCVQALYKLSLFYKLITIKHLDLCNKNGCRPFVVTNVKIYLHWINLLKTLNHGGLKLTSD